MTLASELDICFGHIKHHFLATDWYVIQTDLVSDKEVGVPGSALQYKYPLLVNDEVMLRYTCNEEEMLAENVRLVIQVREFTPLCTTAIGLVSSTAADHVVLDDRYLVPRDCVEGSRALVLQTPVEFEAIKCRRASHPYRCVWACRLDVIREHKLFAGARNQERTTSLAREPRLALRLVEPDLQVEMVMREGETTQPLKETLHLRNMSKRCEFRVKNVHILTGQELPHPVFTLTSPTPQQLRKSLVLGPMDDLLLKIHVQPPRHQGIFYQSLVVEVEQLKILRSLRLVCGSQEFVTKYTTEYKEKSGTEDGKAMYLNHLMLSRLKWNKKRKGSGGGGGPVAKRGCLIDENWAIPGDIRALLVKPNWQQVLRAEHAYVYEPLSECNYTEKLHTCLYVEELELFRHFQRLSLSQYKLRAVAGSSVAHRYLVGIPNLKETRPSLMVFDKVLCLRGKGKEGEKPCQGVVVDLLPNDVVVEMEEDFDAQFHYDVQFLYTRSQIVNQHKAIVLAWKSGRFRSLFPATEAIGELDPVLIDVGISPASGQLTLGTGHETRHLELTNRALDASQRSVIRNILRGELRTLPYLIRGPPGTGKTTTLVEIMLQVMAHNLEARVLVCTQSNSAANLIASKLVDSGRLRKEELVRVVGAQTIKGNVLYASLLPYCASFLADVDGTRGVKMGLTKEELVGFRIVVVTCGLVPEFLVRGVASSHFTHLIVDEAGQCLETDVLSAVALMENRISQMVFVGDDKQLGPVVLCPDLEESGFDVSLFERILKNPLYDSQSPTFNPVLSNQLNYNYRSLPTILHLFNDLFYRSELRAIVQPSEQSAKYQTLALLQSVLPQNPLRAPTQGVFFYDVLGTQQRSESSPSWLNPREASVVLCLLEQMVALGVPLGDIGVIAPYQGQVRYLRDEVGLRGLGKLRIGSVEEFQGQERPVIIISAVRSTEEAYRYTETSHLGFVKNPKRLNVAISRAQSLLVIVGNSIVLSRDPNWMKTIEYCKNRASYVSTDQTLLDVLGNGDEDEEEALAKRMAEHDVGEDVSSLW